MKVAVVFLAVLVAVYGQVPQPCRPLELWEARELKVDRLANYERYAKISVDDVNRRVRRIEEIKIGSQEIYYDELFIANEDRFYRLNLRTRQCNVSRPDHPWHSYGIPPDAKFDGENYIGASVDFEGVLVTRWSGNFSDDDYFAGAWTQPGCFPVIFDTYYTVKKEFTSRTFFDVTEGISDPMVFVPPSECTSQGVASDVLKFFRL